MLWKAEGVKSKTIIFYMHLLKKFLEFYDVSSDSAWRKLRRPKRTASCVDCIPSLAELQKLIMVSRSPRMRLSLQLLAQTGMRISEALNLRIDCIDRKNRVIRIPGFITKTGMPQEVPIISELRDTLQVHLKSRSTVLTNLGPTISRLSKNCGHSWPMIFIPYLIVFSKSFSYPKTLPPVVHNVE